MKKTGVFGGYLSGGVCWSGFGLPVHILYDNIRGVMNGSRIINYKWRKMADNFAITTQSLLFGYVSMSTDLSCGTTSKKSKKTKRRIEQEKQTETCSFFHSSTYSFIVIGQKEQEAKEQKNKVKINDIIIQQNDIDNQLNGIDGRLNGIDNRQNDIDSRQNDIDSRQNDIDSRQNDIGSRQNDIGSRQNDIDSRQNHIDSRLNHIGNRLNYIDSKHNKNNKLQKMKNNQLQKFVHLLNNQKEYIYG
ncbi:MAG: hypothetical protein LBL79_00330 [Prevotella sp.]|jgi:uncharacterized protein (DUF3084 family)|nr:hypothetical protein [Prevotella sp.]